MNKSGIDHHVLYGTHLYYERSCDLVKTTSLRHFYDLIVTGNVGLHSLSCHSHIQSAY